MENIVEVYNKNVYGRDLAYPHNDLAKQLCALMGKETFSLTDLTRVAAIGFEVKNLTFSPDQD